MDHNSKESALVVGSSLVDWEILGDRYDLIDKERLQWLREQNKFFGSKVEELEKRIRVYKRNEKYQFWGYHDLISSQIEKNECDKTEGIETKSDQKSF